MLLPRAGVINSYVIQVLHYTILLCTVVSDSSMFVVYSSFLLVILFVYDAYILKLQ